MSFSQKCGQRITRNWANCQWDIDFSGRERRSRRPRRTHQRRNLGRNHAMTQRTSTSVASSPTTTIETAIRGLFTLATGSRVPCFRKEDEFADHERQFGGTYGLRCRVAPAVRIQITSPVACSLPSSSDLRSSPRLIAPCLSGTHHFALGMRFARHSSPGLPLSTNSIGILSRPINHAIRLPPNATADTGAVKTIIPLPNRRFVVSSMSSTE